MYIFVRLKYSLQKFGFVYVNYVNEHKNSGTNGLKRNKDCRSQKHLQALRFEYRVLSLDLYDLGSANWLRETLLSLNLAERRREDS